MRLLKAIVLAAGKGTRFKSATPKVLHKLAGAPMIEWVLDQARGVGASETIVVVGHGGERVRARYEGQRDLRFVTQEPQLGTGHAVMQAREALAGFDGDLLVLSGDVPLVRPATLSRLYSAHEREKAACTVLTAVPGNPRGYGRVFRDARGRVARIVEQKDLEDGEDASEVNTGLYVFHTPALMARLDRLSTDNAQGEYYLTDLVRLLCEDGLTVAAHECEDAEEARGINDRVDLSSAESTAGYRLCFELMLDHGVTITDPSTTYIERGVKVGRDTIIHPCTMIRAGVEIGQGCEIGPFAHLRSGTKVGNGCKIGAFVETKNAVYGDGAKSGHLAYMGDVTIGAGANIGAGSIVANFDGLEKHRTEIGEKAFIGCGTVLVAPVKVGKNAQTGANTVVPKGKDVPDNTVVVGAPARVLKQKGSDAQ
jgi:bifunctional UDP-N-acetylglucosamine pyrophosphorylase / glucosamine-1-phosphate N-acetyltransferase